MAGLGRASERLENIQSVEPILNALRTVSQASMQAARRRWEDAARYGRELLELASWLPEEVPDRAEAPPGGTLLMALGSDRGLCGSFNTDLAEAVVDHLSYELDPEQEVELWALGSRLQAALGQLGIQPDREERFAEGSVPDFPRALRLAEEIQDGVQEGRFQRVRMIFNQQVRADRNRPVVEQLLPVELAEEPEPGKHERWPPPILETDPGGLGRRIRVQAVQVNLYRFMLTSSAAEHAARFRLLEDASQNMDRLTEELEMEIQLARQQAITTEMMDLIAAAGLLKF